MIRVAILGSTGSIGLSTLEVIERHPERFRVEVLAANRSVTTLREQARRHPEARVIVADSAALTTAHHGGWGEGWDGGRNALVAAAADPEVDVVVNALVGFAGLEPSLRALEGGKRLALANKESLVAGGPLMMAALVRGGGELVPIDSEHSAILQCLEGRSPEEVHRVILTASGGPFREWDTERVAAARPVDALRHPTWDMGAKITVDSATLANKALEVIEAHFLYHLPYDRIGAVVHPQSIIHSFVEFVDGSVLAQLGFPTMELPILYALTYPDRVGDEALRSYDPVAASPLTFEEVDHTRFPLFGLGVDAGLRGGTAPTIFNAANEVAVAAFLRERIPFGAMARVVEATLERTPLHGVETLNDVLQSDREARRLSEEAVDALDPR